jgi:hypothetical protein
MTKSSGKYGKLIQSAKGQQPDPSSGLPDSTTPQESTKQPSNPPAQELSQTPPASHAQIMQPDNQATRQPGNQIYEKRVNLCVKVPESWRKHWAIQAKIHDITMTEVMIQALQDRFGLPDDQPTR